MDDVFSAIVDIFGSSTMHRRGAVAAAGEGLAMGDFFSALVDIFGSSTMHRRRAVGVAGAVVGDG